MSHIFNADNILLNQRFIKRDEVIDAVGKFLVSQGYVTDKYIKAMHQREHALTTYIGNHVAVPHGTKESSEYVLDTGICMFQIPDGVSFGEEMVYIVFGIASKGGSHLDILMCISDIVMEEGNVEKLRHAATKEEVLELIGDIY